MPAASISSINDAGSSITSDTSIPRSEIKATSCSIIMSLGPLIPSPSRSGIADAAPKSSSGSRGGGGIISFSSVFTNATPGLTTAASNDFSTSAPRGTKASPSAGVQPKGGPPVSPGAFPVPPVISVKSGGVTALGASEPIFTIVAVPSNNSTLKSVEIANLLSLSAISSISSSISFGGL